MAMYFIWLIISALCFGYYIVSVNYAGFGSAFVFMWLIAAIAFLAIFITFRVLRTNEIILPSWIRITFWGLFGAGLGLFLILEGLIISQMTATPKDNCEYIIVLGAQIKGTKVSKALKERLDTAYEYSAECPTVNIIVSGGQGDDEEVSEASVMKEYLVAKGIESSRIIMEDKSTDTSENMKFSMAYISDKDASVGIVSSNFHIYRAMKLAQAQGLSDVSGIASPCDSLLFLNYMVRESVGITKDAVMGNY